jgi:hypothetical protein
MRFEDLTAVKFIFLLSELCKKKSKAISVTGHEGP